MNTPNLYQKIISNQNLKENIERYFDFRLIEPNNNLEDFYLKSNTPITFVGEDGSGGCFGLCGEGNVEELPVVFISSDGQAGEIAGNFNGFLSLIIHMPYWFDLLKFSGNGVLSEMKKAKISLEEDILKDYPEVIEIRERIVSELNLSDNELIENLHKAVRIGSAVNIYSLEGESFDSLFNEFTVKNNPLWD